MTKLLLGVFDVPYSATASEGKNGKRTVTVSAETTGMVAEILEAKYHVMEVFFEAHRDEICASIEDSLAGAIENMQLGAPVPRNPLAGALSGLDDKFKTFLSTREIESFGIPGVPTKAALDGVNHRKKLKKGPRRPSFIDTGTYQASFVSWTDED